MAKAHHPRNNTGSLIKMSSLVTRYKEQVRKGKECLHGGGGDDDEDVCIQLPQVTELTNIYNNATAVINTLITKNTDLARAVGTRENAAKQSYTDAFDQLSAKLEAAYAQIRSMVEDQKRAKLALQELQDVVKASGKKGNREIIGKLTQQLADAQAAARLAEGLKEEALVKVMRMTQQFEERAKRATQRATHELAGAEALVQIMTSRVMDKFALQIITVKGETRYFIVWDQEEGRDVEYIEFKPLAEEPIEESLPLRADKTAQQLRGLNIGVHSSPFNLPFGMNMSSQWKRTPPPAKTTAKPPAKKLFRL